MTRSRDVADTQDNLGGAVAPYVAGKNFIINGGFDIFQRSTFTSQTASAYSLDRWYAGIGGTVTVTQQTTGAPVGSQYCMRVAYNAASSFGNQFQALESANATALAGQTVTATVLVRANASWAATSSQALTFEVQKNSTANTLVGGTWSTISSTSIAGASISTGTSPSSWTKLTVTCAIPNDGTAAGIRVRIGESVVGPSGAYWEMAQCQLEQGSVATPFARAGGSIGGELALCQRYLPALNGGAWLNGYSHSTSSSYFTFAFNVTPRTAPTGITASAASNFTVYNGSATSGAATGVAFDGGNNNSALLRISTTAGTPTLVAGQGALLNPATGSILFTGCEL